LLPMELSIVDSDSRTDKGGPMTFTAPPAASSTHDSPERWIIAIALLILMGLPSRCLAQAAAASNGAGSEPLSEEVNDPTASLTQVQVKDIYTPAQYGTNAQPNTLQIRPLFAIPGFSLIPLDQIARPTIRIVTVPDGKGAATTTAYDDMQFFDLFVMPWPDSRATGLRWGIGPYFVFPTATSRLTGQGAWQAGPAFAYSYRAIPGLNIAGLMQQATSFAYTSSGSVPVTSLTFQPIISYQLGREWYIKSSDATWTFNLRHNKSTTMPISAGFGRVWKLSQGYAIDTSVSGEWMLYRQFSRQTEQFTLNFQAAVLLPQVEF
jgi:hypothetical protein